MTPPKRLMVTSSPFELTRCQHHYCASLCINRWNIPWWLTLPRLFCRYMEVATIPLAMPRPCKHPFESHQMCVGLSMLWHSPASQNSAVYHDLLLHWGPGQQWRSLSWQSVYLALYSDFLTKSINYHFGYLESFPFKVTAYDLPFTTYFKSLKLSV